MVNLFFKAFYHSLLLIASEFLVWFAEAQIKVKQRKYMFLVIVSLFMLCSPFFFKLSVHIFLHIFIPVCTEEKVEKERAVLYRNS